MASHSESHRGVIHGRMIELEQDAGLPEGQEVTVTVRPLVRHEEKLAAGDGIRRSAGGWSDDTQGLDEFLQWNRKQRKIGRAEMRP